MRSEAAALTVIVRIGRIQHDDAVARGQMFFHRGQRPLRQAILQADTGHDAHPLRLDEDLALVAFLRADLLAEGVVGAQEPVAIPSKLYLPKLMSSPTEQPVTAR